MTSTMLSQRDAAQQWGVSRATVQRAIRAGKLSLTPEKRIDPSEMLRVYGEPIRPASQQTRPDESTHDPARIASLQAEIQSRDREIKLLEQNLVDLRSQVQMLTHDRPRRRAWWPWSRGD